MKSPHPKGDLVDNLGEVIARIPRGRVASYSAVGRAMNQPATGRMVGRWMRTIGHDYQWWRVVARSGLLPIGKRDPAGEWEQRARLEEEGVVFQGDRVRSDFFFDDEL